MGNTVSDVCELPDCQPAPFRYCKAIQSEATYLVQDGKCCQDVVTFCPKYECCDAKPKPSLKFPLCQALKCRRKGKWKVRRHGAWKRQGGAWTLKKKTQCNGKKVLHCGKCVKCKQGKKLESCP